VLSCIISLIALLEGIFNVRSWSRHYDTSRKIAGSSPDEVIDFFFQIT
jgi:hypothetical protein